MQEGDGVPLLDCQSAMVYETPSHYPSFLTFEIGNTSLWAKYISRRESYHEPTRRRRSTFRGGYRGSNQVSNQAVTKRSLSSRQVVVKLSSSIHMICDLLEMMIKSMSAKEMRQFCDMKDATYFKKNIIDALIEDGLVAMTQLDSLRVQQRSII